ncbi:GDP-mannose-dependent monoacylated alpha-(1-6)-phosphatidylinositol monomannoside mannosyltransferase [bacterium HR27]|nr:GDP-mannose-dependent monoacylated alpha-(1-6)-phosphatidylinositol monomannoside mannosyltransferase [bacterium HR27]
MSAVRTAIVHDYLNQYGGAERVLEVLHALFPDAPVYTSIYAPDRLPAFYRSWDVRTSWLQRLPAIHRKHQLYLPLYPLAFSRLRLDGFDLVVSSSSAFAKSVRVSPGTVHICYCHSPMRFAWDFTTYAAREELPALVRQLLRPFMAWLRRWDRRTAQHIDVIVANSHTVAERIRRYWGRDAVVVHPPVSVDRAQPAPPQEIGDYFLLVSRLVHYKRLDIVIEACNQLRLPLKVIGDGRARSALERLAGPTVQFLGTVSDEEKFHLYARCRAAIFPAEDDFGIAQVEVQAAGRPAIALARGGACETVVDGVTGVLFPEQTVESLVAALRRFEHLQFDPGTIRQHAERFRPERFQAAFTDIVRSALAVRSTSPQRRREALAPWN